MGGGESKMALIKVTYVCPDCKEVVFSQFEKLIDGPDAEIDGHRSDDVLCEPCSEAEVLSFKQFYKGY